MSLWWVLTFIIMVFFLLVPLCCEFPLVFLKPIVIFCYLIGYFVRMVMLYSCVCGYVCISCTYFSCVWCGCRRYCIGFRLVFTVHHHIYSWKNICIKMVAFQFYLQLGKQKSRMGLGWQSCCFLIKNPSEKGSVRWCFVMMQQQVLLSSKFGMNFHIVAVKSYSSMLSWLFGLPGRILCEQSPWCQR
jgi:hypothetical protein